MHDFWENAGLALTFLTSLVGLITALSNHEGIKEIHFIVNSRTDQMLAKIASLERVGGEQAQQLRDSKDKPPA